MRKFGTITMAALLAGTTVAAYTVNAEEQVNDEKHADASMFLSAGGTIEKIETRDKDLMVTVVGDEEIITNFRINEDTLLFNTNTTDAMKASDLKEGMHVEGFYDKNKPMIMIYPPQPTPELFFVSDEKEIGSVKVGKFDEDYLSYDKELKLNIGDQTIIENQQGEKIGKEELKDNELIVFYSVTTKSLPPQTSPNKIIVLNEMKEDAAEKPDEGSDSDSGEMEAVQTIIENDHHMKDGVKMIPLRKVAEELGYRVESQPKLNGALITKGNRSFTITRGEKMYGFNKSVRQFQVAPELLEKNKTYVSEDFLVLLMGDN